MAVDRRYTDPRTGEVIDDPEIRPFKDVLTELGEGATHSELSDAFWEVISRVQETGKAGSLTLTLSIQTNGAGRIEIKDEVKTKLPEFARPTSMFFIDRHGNASRRDPNQPALPGVTHLSTFNREAN